METDKKIYAYSMPSKSDLGLDVYSEILECLILLNCHAILNFGVWTRPDFDLENFQIASSHSLKTGDIFYWFDETTYVPEIKSYQDLKDLSYLVTNYNFPGLDAWVYKKTGLAPTIEQTVVEYSLFEAVQYAEAIKWIERQDAEKTSNEG